MKEKKKRKGRVQEGEKGGTWHPEVRPGEKQVTDTKGILPEKNL